MHHAPLTFACLLLLLTPLLRTPLRADPAPLTPDQLSEFEALLATPWTETKDATLANFFRPLSEPQLITLAEKLRAIPATREIDTELRALGYRWGQLNGRAAMEFLTQLYPRDKNGLLNPAAFTLTAWAATDREACARYIQEMAANPRHPASWRAITLNATSAALSKTDFAYAQKWAEQQGPLRHVAIRGAALAVPAQHMHDCARWLADLSREEGDVYDALMDGFVHHYTETHPEKALHWLLHDLAPGDTRDIALKYGFRLLGGRAPDLAQKFFDDPAHEETLFRGRDATPAERPALHDEFYMEYLDGLAHSYRIEEVLSHLPRLHERKNRWRMERAFYAIYDRYLLAHPELVGGKGHAQPTAPQKD